MPVVRVYVPVGRADLDELAGSGRLPAGPGAPRSAYAVTPGLEQAAPGLDVEDLEYAAFSDAVAAAAAARSVVGHRRAVAAADADPSWVAPSGGEPVSRVALTSPLPLSRVASFHIDEEGAGPDDEADERLWYDVTELDDVRTLVGATSDGE